MDVTRSNFKAILPDIQKAIQNADFLCIDGEFTGLRIGGDINAFSTPAEYYQKLLTDSTPFLLIQFGLSAFRYDKTSKSFKHCAFNFYLFPRSTGRFAKEKIFSCQSSSIDFLAGQKFDFNKLFNHGISYATTAEQVKMREYLEERQAQVNEKMFSNVDSKTDPKALIKIPDVDKDQIEDLCDKVKKFLEEGTADCIEFDNLNSFIRRLLFQELEIRFPNSLHVASKALPDKKCVLVVSRINSKEELIKKNEEIQQSEWNELEDTVGFSVVAKEISESRKLVIGHCLLLDMVHVLGHFFSPLPESYTEFKEFASFIFPRILDTMFMASLQPFKEKISGISLSSLTTTLSEEPFHMPPIESENENNLVGYVTNDSKYHEAGYDAYMTGRCFLSLCDYLARSQNSSIDDIDFSSDTKFLKPFLNKIYLFKTSFQDSPYINLKGNDANPSRDHVFHMEFPKEWKKSDIINMFYQYGGVNVAFINETSAYVGLKRREQTSLVQRTLGLENSSYKLTPYKKYKIITSKINLDIDNNTSSKSRYHQTHWVADKKDKVSEEQHSTLTPSIESLGIARKRKPSEGICPMETSEMPLPELVPRDSALGIAAMSVKSEDHKKVSPTNAVEDIDIAKKRRMNSRSQTTAAKGKHQEMPVIQPKPTVKTHKKIKEKKKLIASDFIESDDWE